MKSDEFSEPVTLLGVQSELSQERSDAGNYGAIKKMTVIVSMYFAVLSVLLIWIACRPQIKAALLAVQNALIGWTYG